MVDLLTIAVVVHCYHVLLFGLAQTGRLLLVAMVDRVPRVALMVISRCLSHIFGKFHT